MEIGPAAAVGNEPQMPYTQALLSAVPAEELPEGVTTTPPD